MKRGGSIFAAALAALIVVRVAAMLVAPVFEPSEARYAAISANMARTGDWFVPSFTYKGVYQPFAGKPPFAFQASALSCKALGVSEFAVRLPSGRCAGHRRATRRCLRWGSARRQCRCT